MSQSLLGTASGSVEVSSSSKAILPYTIDSYGLSPKHTEKGVLLVDRDNITRHSLQSVNDNKSHGISLVTESDGTAHVVTNDASLYEALKQVFNLASPEEAGIDAIRKQNFDIPEHDERELQYVTSGNGIGEVEYVIYKLSSVEGARLTFTYNGSDELTSIVLT